MRAGRTLRRGVAQRRVARHAAFLVLFARTAAARCIGFRLPRLPAPRTAGASAAAAAAATSAPAPAPAPGWDRSRFWM